MPTILVLGDPDWHVRSNKREAVLSVANWTREVIPGILNEVDRRGEAEGLEPLDKDQVWVNFGRIDQDAINAANLLVLALIPQVDADYEDRVDRRRQIKISLREAITSRARRFGLTLPENWEIEIIPVESSGYGFDQLGDELHSW